MSHGTIARNVIFDIWSFVLMEAKIIVGYNAQYSFDRNYYWLPHEQKY